jgi:regulator of replication initiation timing
MFGKNKKEYETEIERIKKENDGLRKAVIRLMEENANLKAEKGTLNEKLYFSMEMK